LGTISYSIYIWQQPFTTLWLQDFPASMRLPAVLAVAVVSYACLERPLMRLRTTLHRPDNSGIEKNCLPAAAAAGVDAQASAQAH
jgi:peptidoglycan/LPS O-acetylase OafA/YrhL